jgi:putative methyltransferase
MKNIYFFQPNYVVNHGDSIEPWMPYTVGSLWAYAKQDYEIAGAFSAREFFYRRENPEAVLDRIDSPAAACFSSYMWNWKYNLAVASMIKRCHPDCSIIFGGPQVPNDTTGFFHQNPQVDICAHGEGEETLRRLLKYIHGGKDELASIRGISFPDAKGETVKTAAAGSPLDLETLPSPYLEGIFDPIIDAAKSAKWQTNMETNRGCPFSCTFCDWGSLTYSKVRRFPKERVFAEIEWICRQRIGYLFIADANFGIFKKRDSEIVDVIVEQRRRTGYPETINVQWNKNSNRIVIDLAKRLVKAGNRGVTLSPQSMSPDVLDAIERKNIGADGYREMLDLCRKENIPAYTELILGLPEETFDSWKSGICQVLELGQHNSIDVWILDFIQNAKIKQPQYMEKYGLSTAVIYDYLFSPMLLDESGVAEESQVVYETKSMSHEKLIQSWLYSWMILNFHSYGWLQGVSRVLAEQHGFSYEAFYDAFWEYVSKQSAENSFIGSELEKTRNLMQIFFRNKAEDGPRECTFTAGWALLYESQIDLHREHDQVWKELTSFLESLRQRLGVDDAFFKELVRFQNHFVTSPKRSYPYQETFDYDLVMFLSESGPVVEKPTTVEFDILFPCRDIQEYENNIMFKRRQGFCKARLTVVESEKNTDDAAQLEQIAQPG